MSGKNTKLTESQNVVTIYDVTVTTASTSSVATATLTFDSAFSATPDVLNCYVNDGTKNRILSQVQAEAISASQLTVRLRGDITLTDGTVVTRVIVHGKF